MNILISCGGTAGHINPAIAIADLIRRNRSDASILFVGTPDGMENRLVCQAGYRIAHIPARGFTRSFSPKNLSAAYYAAVSPFLGKKLLKKEAAQLVIGTGGYACYPTVLAATRMGLPSFLHESNAFPGLAVRKLATKVNCVMLNDPSAATYLPTGTRTAVVGNPVRSSFASGERAQARAALGIPPHAIYILAFGGSRGADSINRTIISLLPELTRKDQLWLTLGCGQTHYNSMQPYFENLPHRFRLEAYLDRMALEMQAADLAICRSGAMTLTELARAALPAILIPFPYAAANHQYHNAVSYAKNGAAIVCQESELNTEVLLRHITEFTASEPLRRQMQNAARKHDDPDTDEKILHLLFDSGKNN